MSTLWSGRFDQAPDAAAFRDLADPAASLRAQGVSHGSLLYLRYTVQREVTPTVGVETRPYGAPPPPQPRKRGAGHAGDGADTADVAC